MANDRSLAWSMLLRTHPSGAAAGVVVILVLGPVERVMHVVAELQVCMFTVF